MAITFGLGNVVATKSVWELIDSNPEFSKFVTLCLSRYIANDWGRIARGRLEAERRIREER